MTITFENDSEVIVYALETIISFARENQYLFMANYAWWIAGIIGLDSWLIIHIDNLEARKEIINYRAVSETSRDIAREVSPEQQRSKYIPDPLTLTRRGRINPLLQTKRQLRKARRAEKKQSFNKTLGPNDKPSITRGFRRYNLRLLRT